MNGKELIFKAMNHEKTERVPWVPYTGVQIGSLRGYGADEVLRDEDKLLECLLLSNELYSPDGQPVVFDLQIEAEILGCELNWEELSPPTVASHPFKDSDEIPGYIPKKSDGRIPLILNVMKNMKREVGESTALYGLICGPFTLASHLKGTDIFIKMFQDVEYVERLIKYTTDVCKQMADYYTDAGMDIIGVVDPLISQISPAHFNQFFKEPYIDVFKHIRSRDTLSSFFVCGDATKNLEIMCETDPDCLSIDENIDIVKAKEITDRYNIAISGNIQLTITMLLGNQKDNQKAAIELIDSLGNENFILAPGCDMPYDVPKENVIGVGQAVQDVDNTRKFLENYVKDNISIEVTLPDYKNLETPIVEVFTIDSSTCAACGYMTEAAMDMKNIFKDKIDVIERKITSPENIARLEKLNIMNLPAILLNGELLYSSIIPDRESFKVKIEEIL